MIYFPSIFVFSTYLVKVSGTEGDEKYPSVEDVKIAIIVFGCNKKFVVKNHEFNRSTKRIRMTFTVVIFTQSLSVIHQSPLFGIRSIGIPFKVCFFPFHMHFSLRMIHYVIFYVSPDIFQDFKGNNGR